MPSYKVQLSENATLDLGDIYLYIAQTDSIDKAEYVFGKITDTIKRLDENPERGNHPDELLKVGNSDFREVFFKPYRIFYLIEGKKVLIHLIADGRRKMDELLQKRLLTP